MRKCQNFFRPKTPSSKEGGGAKVGNVRIATPLSIMTCNVHDEDFCTTLGVSTLAEFFFGNHLLTADYSSCTLLFS